MTTTETDSPLGAELQTLLQVARIVARGDDAESRIQDILRHLAESLGLMRGRVMISDPSAGEIYIRYAHGLTAAELARGRYRVGEGVSGRVFETGEAVLVPNVDRGPVDLEPGMIRDPFPLVEISFLGVPIVRDDLPVGVLAALRRADEARPARCDLAVMEIAAVLIAQILCAVGEALPWSCPVQRERRRDHRRVLPPIVPVTSDDDLGRESLDLTLRMAVKRHGEGRLHMAADLYLKVAEQSPGSAQARLAATKLLEIAHFHEGQGTTRLAADVLERLQRVINGGDAGGGDPPGGPRPDAWGGQDSAPTDWDSFGDSEGSGGIGVRVR